MTIRRAAPAGADCGKDYAFNEVIARAYKNGQGAKSEKAHPSTPIEPCDLFVDYIYHLYESEFYRAAQKGVMFNFW